MFTTLAETYMTATRMDATLAHRAGESERLNLMRIRQAEKKAWIAEQDRAAARLHRRELLLRMMRLVGYGLEQAGRALSHAGQRMTARQGPECC